MYAVFTDLVIGEGFGKLAAIVPGRPDINKV
jgi:hypothetical protein